MLPTRKSPRAKWIEYNKGIYHVVVCVKDHECKLGEISDFKMNMSVVGTFLYNELSNPQIHHPNIEIPVFQVMPNHFHAIVVINDDAAINPCDAEEYGLQRRPGPGIANALLSRYISTLKASVTRYARSIGIDFSWQSRYYDHAIRGTEDGNRAETYIRNNVINWATDEYHQR